MLTVKALTSSNSAKEYYSHGDYYGMQSMGTWYGKGAEILNLKSDFSPKNEWKFSRMLDGEINGYPPLGRIKDGKREHRPGYDLTFSAPKSFSIEVNLRSDQPALLRSKMQLAVKRTLNYAAENGMIETRTEKAGMVREKSEQLVFALFPHNSNRKLEPQEHIHALLANIAVCKDDKLRSITVDNLMSDIKFLGQVFRNELALELKNLGIELEDKILSDGSSSFEIASVEKEVIKAFSTRRAEIEALFKEYDIITKKEKDRIVMYSRDSKKRISKDILLKTWHDIEQKTLSTLKKDLQKEQEKPEKPTLEEVVRMCIDDISSRQSVFSHNDLIKMVMKYSIGEQSIYHITSCIEQFVDKGELIKHEKNYTTKDLLQKEKEILEMAKKAQNKDKCLLKERYVDKQINNFEKREAFKLNESQRFAVKSILASKSSIIAVDGLAGVGKSTILNAVRDISARRVINLLGFGNKFVGSAPTASASKTLSESAKVESSTLHSFLYKHKGYISGNTSALLQLKKTYSNTVIFTDEASMISTKQMHGLLTLSQKLGFKLVLVGDKHQLGAVEAGKDFEQIIKEIPHIKLDKVIRQQDKEHREAVVQASKGNINKSFEIHDKNIEQHGEKLIQASVKKYMESNSREDTLLISPTKKVRDQINNKIRIELRKENSLTGKITNFTALRQKNFSLADYAFSKVYIKGDVVKFAKQYSNGIEKNAYYKVAGINNIANSITLEKDNKFFVFKFNTNIKYENIIEVYEEINLRLQEGLKIRFTKNNKENSLINSETAIIKNIDKNTITLQLENGKIAKINKAALTHIDYGYCTTIHAAQGKTYEKNIAVIEDNKLLSTQRLWCVIISRHKEEFTALLQDKDKLKSYLMSNEGSKMSAIELHNLSIEGKKTEMQMSL